MAFFNHNYTTVIKCGRKATYTLSSPQIRRFGKENRFHLETPPLKEVTKQWWKPRVKEQVIDPFTGEKRKFEADDDLPFEPILKQARPSEVIKKAKHSAWREMGITSQLCKALEGQDIMTPTEIQLRAMPTIASGKSCVFVDRSGSGKTLGYLVPTIHNMVRENNEQNYFARSKRPRLLVMVPTRELCHQVWRDVQKLMPDTHLHSTILCGGFSIPKQAKYTRGPVDIVIGTPLRVWRMIQSSNIQLDDCKSIVVDECDFQMHDGFWAQIMRVCKHANGEDRHWGPKKKRKPQMIFTTSTIDKSFMKRARETFGDLKKITGPKIHRVSEKMKPNFIYTQGKNKMEQLTLLLRQRQKEIGYPEGDTDTAPTLVFCSRKRTAAALDHYLNENGLSSSLISSHIPPKERQRRWDEFQSGEKTILVCSDVAYRGLHPTSACKEVVLYDFPRNGGTFLHRAGRVARMEEEGQVTAFVKKRDKILAGAIYGAMLRGEQVVGLNRVPSRYAVTPVAGMTTRLTSRRSGKNELLPFVPADVRLLNKGESFSMKQMRMLPHRKISKPRLWYYPSDGSGRRLFWGVRNKLRRREKTQDMLKSEDRRRNLLERYMTAPTEFQSRRAQRMAKHRYRMFVRRKEEGAKLERGEHGEASISNVCSTERRRS